MACQAPQRSLGALALLLLALIGGANASRCAARLRGRMWPTWGGWGWCCSLPAPPDPLVRGRAIAQICVTGDSAPAVAGSRRRRRRYAAGAPLRLATLEGRLQRMAAMLTVITSPPCCRATLLHTAAAALPPPLLSPSTHLRTHSTQPAGCGSTRWSTPTMAATCCCPTSSTTTTSTCAGAAGSAQQLRGGFPGAGAGSGAAWRTAPPGSQAHARPRRPPLPLLRLHRRA